MKKTLIMIIVFLIVWTMYLSYEINLLKDETVNNTQETTVIHTTVNGFSTDLTAVIDNAQSQIVGVNFVDNGELIDSTTGVVWEVNDDEVIVLTDATFYKPEMVVQTMFENGAKFQSEVIGIDEVTKLMAIKMTVDFKVEEIQKADSSLSKDGEWVIAIGSDLINENYSTISIGALSMVNQVVTYDIDDDNINDWKTSLMQADINVAKGNNGGLVLNMESQLLGICYENHVAVDDFGASIYPVNEIKLIVDQLINNGSASRLLLGVTVLDIQDLKNYEKSNNGISLDMTEGIYIEKVESNSLAHKIGIIKGDILLTINNQNIGDYQTYRSYLYEITSDEFSSVTVLRDNDIVELSVVNND